MAFEWFFNGIYLCEEERQKRIKVQRRTFAVVQSATMTRIMTLGILVVYLPHVFISKKTEKCGNMKKAVKRKTGGEEK